MNAGSSVTTTRRAMLRAPATATVIGLVAVAALVTVPAPAFAHGVGGTSQTVSGFVWLGFRHMLLGWDHLLFVGGVLLLAGDARRAAKLISLFALGHSLTLIMATLAGWRVNPTLVDVLIALSLVFVGVVGWFGRPTRWEWFAAVVFGFGLIHGLGLATRLQAVGLPSDGVLARVVAFNIGVELGQLAAVVLMFLIGSVAARRITWPKAWRVTHSGLIAVGLVGATLLAVTGASISGAKRSTLGSCTVQDGTATYSAGGGRPAKRFLEPTETLSDDTIGGAVGDGYIVVRYQAKLPTDQLEQLRFYVTGPTAGRIFVAPAAKQAEILKAVNAYSTLACNTFDLLALMEFADRWFADPRSRPG
jgi:hydrogenase/urease accessory protein HupE